MVNWDFFRLENAFIILVQSINGNYNTDRYACEQLYNSYDNKRIVLRFLKGKEQGSENYHHNADDESSQADELAEGLSVLLGHS